MTQSPASNVIIRPLDVLSSSSCPISAKVQSVQVQLVWSNQSSGPISSSLLCVNPQKVRGPLCSVRTCAKSPSGSAQDRAHQGGFAALLSFGAESSSPPLLSSPLLPPASTLLSSSIMLLWALCFDHFCSTPGSEESLSKLSAGFWVSTQRWCFPPRGSAASPSSLWSPKRAPWPPRSPSARRLWPTPTRTPTP